MDPRNETIDKAALADRLLVLSLMYECAEAKAAAAAKEEDEEGQGGSNRSADDGYSGIFIPEDDNEPVVFRMDPSNPSTFKTSLYLKALAIGIKRSLNWHDDASPS